MDHQSKPHITRVGYLRQFDITMERGNFFCHPTLNSIHNVNLSSEILKKSLKTSKRHFTSIFVSMLRKKVVKY